MRNEEDFGNYYLPVALTTPTYPLDLDAGTVYTGVPTATGVYGHSGRTVTQVGAFATYTFAAGDYFLVLSGSTASVFSGWYPIASKTSNDVIVLSGIGMGLEADTATTIVGMIHKVNSPYIPAGRLFKGIVPHSGTPAYSMGCPGLVIRRWAQKWTTAPAAARTLTYIDLYGSTIATQTLNAGATATIMTASLFRRIAPNRGLGGKLDNVDAATCDVGWMPSAEG